ncbi:unnamed protein product [Staurois parvus]|uniref:Ribosomal protein L32 n=1 Tax=Staurois parvus TaxID=386267 RepID=A0ABN9ATG8_9NEOB|nr:unnamed protein product [Staurois parvus]
MHPPKKRKKKIHTKLSMFSLYPVVISTRGGTEKKGANSLFTQCSGLTA